MTVYVDQIRDYGGMVKGQARRYGTRWCHMWADSEEELRVFAVKIGMRTPWIQHPMTKRVHFDLVPRRRELAIQCGAIEKEVRDWLREQRAEAHS